MRVTGLDDSVTLVDIAEAIMREREVVQLGWYQDGPDISSARWTQFHLGIVLSHVGEKDRRCGQAEGRVGLHKDDPPPLHAHSNALAA